MTDHRKTLSLVVPVYYNAESILELHSELESLSRRLDSRGVDLELIFVNDGSGDESLARLLQVKQLRPATKVINLSRNFGAVAASKTGFGFVTGDAFTVIAADLQDPPEQILEMVDRWLAGAKFVISVRASRKDPPVTRLFAWIYYRIVDWMVVKNYPAGGFDLMLMDRAMLQYMIGSTKNTNPNMYAFWLGFTPVKLPYHRRERRHGRSRWTFGKKLKFFVDTVSGFSVTPLRILSLFGIGVALASFAYGASVAVSALLGHVQVRGFATLAALISFFSGLILFMLGALGEYLWRVFDAVNNKPEAVIEDVFL
ncbi:MAG TPA: glycosyltransferase family 2 protein [Rhodopseudomonas sp.]|uniref:glycosyltransferase family 2 protein n=1 Tax=Rhodopseudomonas sp. TaxID=1078 RepID=UPI002ED845D7